MGDTIPPRIRLITNADSEALWRIRNSESVRTASHTPAVIPRIEHNAWFLKYRTNPNNACWVAEVDEQVAGYCRIDDALVSIAIDERFTGQGLGKILLTNAIYKSKQRWPKMRAEIQVDNIASLRLFEKVGFKRSKVVGRYVHLEFHAA